jgi:hypothetical protein
MTHAKANMTFLEILPLKISMKSADFLQKREIAKLSKRRDNNGREITNTIMAVVYRSSRILYRPQEKQKTHLGLQILNQQVLHMQSLAHLQQNQSSYSERLYIFP